MSIRVKLRLFFLIWIKDFLTVVTFKKLYEHVVGKNLIYFALRTLSLNCKWLDCSVSEQEFDVKLKWTQAPTLLALRKGKI